MWYFLIVVTTLVVNKAVTLTCYMFSPGNANFGMANAVQSRMLVMISIPLPQKLKIGTICHCSFVMPLFLR